PRSFLVSGRRIFELVKEMVGEIVFTLHDTHIVLTSGTVRLSLNIKDAEAFPSFPERIENLMQFDADYFLEMISKVAFLIPQNNANQALNGLLFEISLHGCSLTATDGHCLVQVT